MHQAHSMFEQLAYNIVRTSISYSTSIKRAYKYFTLLYSDGNASDKIIWRNDIRKQSTDKTFNKATKKNIDDDHLFKKLFHKWFHDTQCVHNNIKCNKSNVFLQGATINFVNTKIICSKAHYNNRFINITCCK